MDFNNFKPDPRDFELLTVIGSSTNSCGAISAARHTPSNEYVAVKRINLEQADVDFTWIQHEVSQHKMLSHPNILPVLCSFVHDKEVWMVMPLTAFGSCRDLMQAHFHDGLPEMVIAYILRDILQALDYLHTKGIIHRSVRASHILVAANGQVSLSGLRFSYSMMDTGKRARSVFDFPNNYVSSLLWASPELLKQDLAGYDTKSDIYSVGMTACELANGVAPFSDIPPMQMLLAKVQGITPKLLDSSSILGDNPVEGSASSDKLYQKTFSSHFHNFVELCVQSDPTLRPSAATLLQHSFFKQVKRKSQMDSLPLLLQPIQPLTLVGLPRDDSTLQDLTEAMADVSMTTEDSWDF